MLYGVEPYNTNCTYVYINTWKTQVVFEYQEITTLFYISTLFDDSGFLKFYLLCFVTIFPSGNYCLEKGGVCEIN